jgi:hypothetical protein
MNKVCFFRVDWSFRLWPICLARSSEGQFKLNQTWCWRMAFVIATMCLISGLREGSWRGISREPGGKGSFQAVKLQRPARTTVCSHSTRDMAAIGSIESKHDNDDAEDECLSSCEQLWSGTKKNIRTPCSARAVAMRS